MDKFNKNKIQYVGVRPGERDIDESVPVIEYCNMPPELKNQCIKLSKEAISIINKLINKQLIKNLIK